MRRRRAKTSLAAEHCAETLVVASPFPAADQAGTIYLIHYSAPTAAGRQHYLGWSSNVSRRFAQHRSGHGAGQTRKAIAEGLKLTLAQTWPGTPSQERELKEAHRRVRRGFGCMCPFCDADRPVASSVIEELGGGTLRVARG